MSTTEHFHITDPPSWDQLFALVGTENRIVVTLTDGNTVMAMDAGVIERLEDEIKELQDEVASLCDQNQELGEDLAAWENVLPEPQTSIEEAARAFGQAAIRRSHRC